MTAAVRGTGPGNPAGVAAPGAESGTAGGSPGPARSPLGRRILLIAVFLLALANGVAAFRTVGRWHLPPVPGDGQDYDNIALNLVRARGFGQFWNDPEWRAPYVEHNEAGIYDGILARSGAYSPTAYRPPVLPAALAVTYALLGRSFLVWGLIHALIAAAALTIAVHLALRLGGLVPALILLAMALSDRSLMYFLFACPLLTEGWSCLAVGLFAVALARIGKRGAPRDFVLGGAALGLLVLVRGIFVVWYPFAALGILGLALWQTRPATGGRRTRALALCGLFLAGALLVPMPWWIRNCVVTGKLMPLGTQGGINLPIGYSDSALASGGLWTPDAARRFWAEHATPATERDDIHGETAKAEVGQRAALAWARSNLTRLPGLMALKARDLWNDPWSDPRRGLLVLFALAALPWGLREGRESLALWAVLALNTLGVMLTYGDGVRFLVPVKPLLFALVGLGLWRTAVVAGELVRKVAARGRG